MYRRSARPVDADRVLGSCSEVRPRSGGMAGEPEQEPGTSSKRDLEVGMDVELAPGQSRSLNTSPAVRTRRTEPCTTAPPPAVR